MHELTSHPEGPCHTTDCTPGPSHPCNNNRPPLLRVGKKDANGLLLHKLAPLVNHLKAHILLTAVFLCKKNNTISLQKSH